MYSFVLVHYSSSAPGSPCSFKKLSALIKWNHVERMNFMVQLLPLTCVWMYTRNMRHALDVDQVVWRVRVACLGLLGTFRNDYGIFPQCLLSWDPAMMEAADIHAECLLICIFTDTFLWSGPAEEFRRFYSKSEALRSVCEIFLIKLDKTLQVSGD